jgi:hypothetical protein
VPYGEVWQCHSCGRRWNTGQIPAGEYWGIMRDMRRMRFSVIGIAVALTAIFGLLAIFVAETLILLLPVLLGVWLVLYMPWWRRKVRRRARNVPKWNLHPE